MGLAEVAAADQREVMTTTTRQQRLRRFALVHQRARRQDGVLHRRQLYAFGLTRAEVEAELRARRWRRHGRQAIAVHTGPLSERARFLVAVFETSVHSTLDGVSALVDAGMTGFVSDVIHVSVPKGVIYRRCRGVRVHETRRRFDGDAEVVGGLSRAVPGVAAIRGALWATSDRQASLVLIMCAQQGVVAVDELELAFLRIRRDKRRSLIKAVLGDIRHGVHSMGELDFARLCRQRGLPPPTRQVWRRLPHGRACLDVYWDRYGVVVEIEGVHHGAPGNVIDDSIRQNSLTLDHDKVLRIPVVGLRTDPEAFLRQVEELLRRNGWQAA